MGAETVEDMERLADEIDTRTFLYWRRNGAGVLVRDAKFIEDASDYDIAVTLFAGHVEGAEVGLCAVLRGKVETEDDIERADRPVMDDAAHEELERLNFWLLSRSNPKQYTVYGSWDTGDGHRRYAKAVPAMHALHAEMIVRGEIGDEGEFLVAAVVEGCVPNEDTDEVWATVDGEPWPVPDTRPWWKKVFNR